MKTLKPFALFLAAAALAALVGCQNPESSSSTVASASTSLALGALSSEALADTRVTSVVAVVSDEFDTVLGEVTLAAGTSGWAGTYAPPVTGSLSVRLEARDASAAVLYEADIDRVDVVSGALNSASASLLPHFTVTEWPYATITGLAAGRSTRVNDFVVSGTSYYAATTGGLAISVDSGVTWTLYTPLVAMATGGTSDAVTSVKVSTSSSTGVTTIYAGTANGLAVSTDAGATWALTTFGTTDANLLSVQGIYLRSSSIYVATSGGIHVSADLGVTWTTTATTTAARSFYRESSQIWAATATGLLKTADSGKTWSSLVPYPYGTYSTNSLYAVTRWDGRLALGSAAGLHRLGTDLTSWTTFSTSAGLGGTTIRALGATASGLTLVAATSGGLSFSTDGGTVWTNLTEGLTSGVALYALSIQDTNDDDVSDVIWAGGANGLTRYLLP